MNKRFWKRNSSTILTVTGGVGVVATVAVTVRSTVKAVDILAEAKDDKGEDLTKMEVVKAVGPTYIPTVLIAGGTIACIFGANILNKRNQAALVSAYTLLDQSYKEYKKKVEELYGESTDKIVRSEITKDHYDEDEFEDGDDGKSLFYDEYSERYFRATNETVLKAAYEINKMVSEGPGAMTLNDYYKLVGLEPMDYGDFIGWDGSQLYEHNWSDWVNFEYEKVVMDDGLECHIITMTNPLMFD